MAKESEAEEGSAMGEREWSIMWYGAEVKRRRFAASSQANEFEPDSFLCYAICMLYVSITSWACGIWRLHTETATSGRFGYTSAISCLICLHFGNHSLLASPLQQSIASFVSNSE